MSAVDDAVNFDNRFQTMSFDLICTHFITGFVPLALFAPNIANKLKSGGSFRIRLGHGARAWVENRDWAHSIDRVRQSYDEAIRDYRPASACLTLRQQLARAVVSALVFGFQSVAKSEIVGGARAGAGTLQLCSARQK